MATYPAGDRAVEATRYEKRAATYVAMITCAVILLWF
jgi:hypothetical protein